MDSTHRTVEEYHRGNLEEQSFHIGCSIETGLTEPGASADADEPRR